MQGGALIAQGGYGCIFHPELNCQGKETKNKSYVTKLQRKDFSAENEIFIGQNLRKGMPSNILDAHFAPVIDSCPINISKLHHLDHKCSVMKKMDASDLILMKIRYIDSIDLDSFIVQNNNSSFIFLTLISSFNHLLKSIRMLIGLNIVHNDLKGQNIIYSTKKSLPIIIDFGLSLPLSKITGENLYNYFYIYAPEYYIWPLEMHLLNLLLHVTPEPTEKMLRELADKYTTYNAALQSFSHHFKKQFADLCFKELMKYIKMDHKSMKTKIMKSWVTWDNYSLSIIYLKFVYFIIRSENGNILKNPFVIFITKLLLMNIHPNPEKRHPINETIKIFNQFLYSEKVDKVSVFEEIVERLHDSKQAINKIVTLDQRRIGVIAKRISKK